MAPGLVKPTSRNSNGLRARENTTAVSDDGFQKYAYVTFLAGDGDYVRGVIGLAKGLKKVRAAYPLVVAVLPDVPEDHRRSVAEQGCLLREIQPLSPENVVKGSTFVRDYFVVNYCKLRLWEFVEYNKLVYMDADIQVFDNIDHLFDLPRGHFYGVVDCLCDMYGQPCDQKPPWPKELGQAPAYYFNGGMFVFEPSLDTYSDLLSTLKFTPPTSFAEQDFLNMYFRDIAKPLSPVYNLLIAMLWRHPEWVDLKNAKVVHYCVAGSKPWRFTGKGDENMNRSDVKMLVKRWWDIYNDRSLDFNNHHLIDNGNTNSNVVNNNNNNNFRTGSGGDISTADVVAKYVSAPPAA